MDLKKKIGEKIREIRKSQNLDQKCLAEKININNIYLCRIERGKSYPSIQLLEKIADYFEVGIQYFFAD